jgi:hypothetical protein
MHATVIIAIGLRLKPRYALNSSFTKPIFVENLNFLMLRRCHIHQIGFVSMPEY